MVGAPGGPLRGPEAAKYRYEQLLKDVRPEELVCTRRYYGEDFCVVEHLCTCTVTGEFAGIPGNGRQVSFRMLHIFEFQLGKISRENVWMELDICAFLDATEERTAEDLLPWHRRSLPCATMTCLLIGEQLLHGYDMAQALGAEWPIETEPARLAVQALLPLLPALVDSAAAKGVNASYELAVHDGPRVVARFRDGTGSIDPSDDGLVDCRLSSDPVGWLLALYGRVGWEALLRTGRVTVSDGDATLGAGFKRLLRNP